MSLYRRFTNEWTGLGIIFGLFVSSLYKAHTQDSTRTLLFGAAIVILAILLFNFSAFIYSDAAETGLTTVIEFIGVQTFAGVLLTGLAGYAMFGLPFTPAANWTAIAPPPERIAELIDTPFGNDQTWTFRAKSEHQNMFVYVCGSGECRWYTENEFLERDWGELSYNFTECQEQAGNRQTNRPQQPPNAVDTHFVYGCGADVQMIIHLVLTEDGTIWHWTSVSTALTGLGLLYMLMFSVVFVFIASTIISLARFQQYRFRAR